MSFGMSAQGTIIRRSIDPNWPDNAPQGGALDFVEIAELMDITPPALTRNPIETTSHNELDDRYVVGIRRHGEMSMNINYVPTDPSHDHNTGLAQAWQDGSRDIYEVEFVEGSKWLFSGFVTNLGPAAPVDDRFSADVTIRPTGAHQFVEPA